MIDSPPNLVLVGIKRLDSFRWKFRICFIENYRGGGKVTQGSRIEIELHRNLRLLCGRVVITIEIIPLAIGICSPLSKFSGFSWRGGRGVVSHVVSHVLCQKKIVLNTFEYIFHFTTSHNFTPSKTLFFTPSLKLLYYFVYNSTHIIFFFLHYLVIHHFMSSSRYHASALMITPNF